MAVSDNLLIKGSRRFSTTIGAGGVANDSATTIPLSSVPAIFSNGDAIEFVVDRVSTTGTLTTDKEETIVGEVSGSNVINCARGVEGTAQAHSAGAVVEIKLTADMWNRLVEWGLVEHAQDGTHDATKVAMLAGTQTFTGDKTFSGDVAFSGAVTGVAAFWANVPGTPTRVSDTQFTITDASNANSYDLLFKKGVILKWLESTTFQTAMVISSSYSSDAVTINIVGDSLTAGFSAMQYAIPHAQKQTFIIPGTLAAATDIARTFYVPEPMYVLSCDAYVKTAGTTNATEFDCNDDGTSLFGGTAASIASGATSDEDNTAAAPSTAVAEGSLLTIDVNSVSTTAPVEAYIDVWMYPADWRYR